MNKIPTIYLRDPEDMKHVTDQPNPECAWVFTGEGVATRKYDGTCVMFDGTSWWARREVKPGKTPPPNYVPVTHDEITGKTMGWEPISQSAFGKYVIEALEEADDADASGEWTQGTYELVGPKINGNPERLDYHLLLKHEWADKVRPFSLTYDGIRDTVLALAKLEHYEGLVWHHPDGLRMAKIKARDFVQAEREASDG